MGFIESHAPIVPTLLDSLGPDNESSSLIPGGVGGPSDDECSSAHSEFCWGEMEDIGDDEVQEWGCRRTERTYPVLVGPRRRARLVVLAV